MRRVASVAAWAAFLATIGAGCSLPGAVKGPVKLTAEFDDVGDLVVNHSVQIADVRVGSITKIELTRDFHAKVTMEVKQTGLTEDAIAELRTTSLLGEKFIQLRPCDPKVDGSICKSGAAPLKSGFSIQRDHSKEAPELERIADYAARLLGGIAVNDISTLIQTGSQGFGGRGNELRALVGDLSTISGTLADQTSNITRIIDGLDKAGTALAGNNASVDSLLVNLQATTQALADDRQQAVATLQQLTRLMQDQDKLVFEPYLATVDRQVKQIDAILQEVTQGRQQVGLLLDWLERFVYKVPQGVPDNFVQVYGWFIACPGAGC